MYNDYSGLCVQARVQFTYHSGDSIIIGIGWLYERARQR